MSEKDKAIEILDKLFCRQDNKKEMIAELMDNIIEAAKEELTPKDQTDQEFFGLDHEVEFTSTPFGQGVKFIKTKLRPYQQKAIDDLMESFKEPKLIQGYTAEQWQEIIDGGYLCEFGFPNQKSMSRRGFIAKIDGTLFVDEHGDNWQFCRPAQIKGVMRPIFVEPSDKDACCHFFDSLGAYCGTEIWIDADSMHSLITQYIEV